MLPSPGTQPNRALNFLLSFSPSAKLCVVQHFGAHGPSVLGISTSITALGMQAWLLCTALQAPSQACSQRGASGIPAGAERNTLPLHERDVSSRTPRRLGGSRLGQRHGHPRGTGQPRPCQLGTRHSRHSRAPAGDRRGACRAAGGGDAADCAQAASGQGSLLQPLQPWEWGTSGAQGTGWEGPPLSQKGWQAVAAHLPPPACPCSACRGTGACAACEPG